MTERNSNPNILLIHCHDLGRQLGCYGRDAETPNIDALAEEGALFENHFVTAPQCSPSRASLMTGLHPHANGMIGLAHMDWELWEGVKALPAYLNEAGYETHMFGLQHITDEPGGLGFEYIHSEGNLLPASSPAIHEVNRARDVAETFKMFLKKHSYHEPFFASVGMFELHRINIRDRFGFNDGQYDTADPETVTVPSYLPDCEGIREDIAEMDGMLEALDEGVGTIMSALDTAGLDENTLVIFTTEHGIAFPRAKGSCYDAGIEAALLMRLPELIEGGKRYDELVSNVDLLPTILNLIEQTPPDDIAGRSFLPVLADGKYLPRHCIFAEMSWHDRYNPVRAVRTDQYKYIRSFWHLPSVYLSTDVFVSKAGRELREQYYADSRPYEQLYDLERDPDEQANRADEQEYEAVRTELETRLYNWMEQTDDPLLEGPIVPSDYDNITTWKE